MFSLLDKKIIRMLQEDIPLVSEPYKQMAEELGIEEQLLLKKIQEFSKLGIIRRYGSALFHRKVGFQANAMVVWQVDEERIQAVGEKMVAFEKVTHCYERAEVEGWKYNLFTMIHGKTKEECEGIITEIASSIKESDYEVLYSIEELKKNSMRYFSEINIRMD